MRFVDSRIIDIVDDMMSCAFLAASYTATSVQYVIAGIISINPKGVHLLHTKFACGDSVSNNLRFVLLYGSILLIF